MFSKCHRHTAETLINDIQRHMHLETFHLQQADMAESFPMSIELECTCCQLEFVYKMDGLRASLFARRLSDKDAVDCFSTRARRCAFLRYICSIQYVLLLSLLCCCTVAVIFNVFLQISKNMTFYFVKMTYQKVVKSQQKFSPQSVKMSSHTSLSDHCNSIPSSQSVAHSI